MGEEARRSAGAAIAAHLTLMEERLGWRFVSCYVGFGSEVSTEGWIRERLAAGLRVAVPLADESSGRLLFSEVKDLDRDLTRGTRGIMEPRRERLRPVPPSSFDAVIVPGCAFDLTGRRLGHGLGFYDRFLAGLRGRTALVGLAFSAQLAECLPEEGHDVPMDFVVTERGIHSTGRNPDISSQSAAFKEVL